MNYACLYKKCLQDPDRPDGSDSSIVLNFHPGGAKCSAEDVGELAPAPPIAGSATDSPIFIMARLL